MLKIKVARHKTSTKSHKSVPNQHKTRTIRQLSTTASIANPQLTIKAAPHTSTVIKSQVTSNIPNDTDKPVLNIISYTSNRTFFDSVLSKVKMSAKEAEAVSPTHLITKLFTQPENFVQPPISISQPIFNNTVNDLAAKIQQNAPTRPCFVSFSTKDSLFGKHYYHYDIASGPYHTEYAASGADLSVLRDTVQGSYLDKNGIGLPPIPMNLSKIKPPALPQPFFNNPSKLDTLSLKNVPNLEDQHQLTGFAAIKETFFSASLPRSRRKIDTNATITPKFYVPGAINIPLHPFTPLSDLMLATSVICHMSYTQDQIDTSPHLKSFISSHINDKNISITKNACPPETRKNLDITTISYEITQYHYEYGKKRKDYRNSLMLHRNFDSSTAINPLTLFAMFGIILGSELYLRVTGQEFSHVIDSIFGTVGDSNRKFSQILSMSDTPLSELASLKMEKASLSGINTLTQMRFNDSMSMMDRLTGALSGQINPQTILSQNPSFIESTDTTIVPDEQLAVDQHKKE